MIPLLRTARVHSYRSVLTLTLLVVLLAGSGAAALSGSGGSGVPSALAACPSAPRTPPAVITSQHDGAWNTGFSVDAGGVYAQIQRDAPYIASGSRVTDWVMFTSSSDDKWSQFGWYYDVSSGARVFAQVFNNPGLTTKFGSSSGIGNYPYFTALYNNPSGKLSFQVNSTPWVPSGEGSPYQPNASWAPRNVQIFAERHNFSDQIPGGTAAYAGHYDDHIYSSGAWSDGWLTTYNEGISYHGILPVSGNLAYDTGKTFYVWDTQCSS